MAPVIMMTTIIALVPILTTIPVSMTVAATALSAVAAPAPLTAPVASRPSSRRTARPLLLVTAASSPWAWTAIARYSGWHQSRSDGCRRTWGATFPPPRANILSSRCLLRHPGNRIIGDPDKEQTTIDTPTPPANAGVPVETEFARSSGIGTQNLEASHFVGLTRNIGISPSPCQLADATLRASTGSPIHTSICSLPHHATL